MTCITKGNQDVLGKTLTYLQDYTGHLLTCGTCMEDSPQAQAHRLARMKLLH